jgi:hypothetical protein
MLLTERRDKGSIISQHRNSELELGKRVYLPRGIGIELENEIC